MCIECEPLRREFRTGYMDQALYSLTDVVDLAIYELRDVEFDTLVGTGFSGGIVVPFMATMMNKNFALLRKEVDDSHHGKGNLLGAIGKRWIFVDDFMSSGATKRRVIEKIDAALEGYFSFKTEYIGDYFYANITTKWFPKFDYTNIYEEH